MFLSTPPTSGPGGSAPELGSSIGARDRVASSPGSYVSYLNSVSDLLGQNISPELVAEQEDVLYIFDQVQGQRAPNTIRNYGSALRQYAAIVKVGAHP